MSSSPDHLYLDLSIVNNDTSGESTIPLNFRESRTNPILDNPANYFMSVVRFEVDTPGFSLPIFIPKHRMDGKSDDVNSTAYSVTIATIGGSGNTRQLATMNQTYVEWTPQDKTAALPNNQNQDLPIVGSSVLLQSSVFPITPFNISAINNVNFITTLTPVSAREEKWTIPLQTAPSRIVVQREYPQFVAYFGSNGTQNPYIELGSSNFTDPTGFTERLYEFDSTINPNVNTASYTGIGIVNIVVGNENATLVPFNPLNPFLTGIRTLQFTTASGTFYKYRFYITEANLVPSGEIVGGIIIQNNNLTQAPESAFYLDSNTHNADSSITNLGFNPNPLKIQTISYFGAGTPVGGTPVYTSTQIRQLNLTYNNLIGQEKYLTQDITTGYYNCYSVKWWLSCVNQALETAWGNATIPAPQLVADPNTNLITLMCPYVTDTINFAIGDDVASVSNYLGSPTGTISANPPITHAIFFNEPLFNLFSSFNSIYYGNNIPQATLSTAVKAKVALIPEGYKIFSNYIQPVNYDFMNTTQTTAVNQVDTNWITLQSEYSPVPMWNPIQSFVFTTSMIPVQYSMTNPPQVYGSTQYDQTYSGGGGNNSDISTQISDIQIPLTSGNEYKPTITYTPSGEYRLIDLLGNSPINQIGFQISYKTKFGQVVPFALAPQCGANLKILFRRKRYNLGNVEPYDTN
jgi:hypothetical protein